ncbi:hypothetical protein MBLNU13_g07883t2 [Cladosporium sp. NU13]
MALTTPSAINPIATNLTATKSTTLNPPTAKESCLSDTFTICTDDPQRPIEFRIYGYIITTSTSNVLTLQGYAHWLYTRPFLFRRPEGSKSYSELIDFYFLCEVLKDQTFCQQAVDAMIVIRYDGKKWPDYQVTNDIWKRTPPDSPLRKVMNELWMSTNVDKAMRCLKTAPEPGYHRDVILSLLEELITRGVSVKEATFSGRSRKEVEKLCRKFVQGMDLNDTK